MNSQFLYLSQRNLLPVCRARTPLIDALLAYTSKDKAPFHIPGHKRGEGSPSQLDKIVEPRMLAYDLTELPGNLPSSLHAYIQQANNLLLFIEKRQARDSYAKRILIVRSSISHFS